MSHDQSQFQTLMNLLDRNDDTSSQVWDLIRMLATNEQIYKEVLSLDSALDANGKVQWESFFENKNVYRRIYNLEIIEAVMEEGENAQNSRVKVLCYDETDGKVLRPRSSLNRVEQTETSHDPEFDSLKRQWTKKFIEN